MISLVLAVPVAGFLWVSLLLMFRRIDSFQLMDDLRPTPAEVARIEAELPKMPGDRR